jgi:hypothetical protein
MKVVRTTLIALLIGIGVVAAPLEASAAVKVKITISTPPASSLVVLGTFTPTATSTSGHTLGNGITASVNVRYANVCTMATDGSYTITFVAIGQCVITYVDAPTTLTLQGVAHQVLKIQAVTTGGPTFSGYANVGNVLTGSIGTWDPACGSFTYDWVANGIPDLANQTPLSDGTTTPYTVPITLLNKHLRLRVKGICLINGTSVPIVRVSQVSLVRTAFKITTSQPLITGNPVHGNLLTVSLLNWTPGVTLRYQWFIAGVAIPGAINHTYLTAPADVGRHLRVQVTATKTGYRTIMRLSKLLLIK